MMVSGLCAVVLIMVFSVYQPSSGEYILKIQTNDFANPASTCAECKDQACCDDAIDNICSDMGDERCDDEFFYCLRPLGTPVPTVVNSSVDASMLERSVADRANSLQCLRDSMAFRSEVNENSAPVDYFSVTLLGQPNPLEFQVNDTEWKGIQLYVDVIDSDSATEAQLIDVFTIDIQSSDLPARGDMTSPRIFKGAFGLAFIELRFGCEGCASTSVSINYAIVGGAIGGGVLVLLLLITILCASVCVCRQRTKRAAAFHERTITVPMVNIRGDHETSSYALYSNQPQLPPVQMTKAEAPVAMGRAERKINMRTNVETSQHESAYLILPTTFQPKEEEEEEEGDYNDEDDYELMTAPQLQRPQAFQELIYDNL